jgi:hypothetical protein
MLNGLLQSERRLNISLAFKKVFFLRRNVWGEMKAAKREREREKEREGEREKGRER